jgi:hypothetical protein
MARQERGMRWRVARRGHIATAKWLWRVRSGHRRSRGRPSHVRGHGRQARRRGEERSRHRLARGRRTQHAHHCNSGGWGHRPGSRTSCRELGAKCRGGRTALSVLVEYNKTCMGTGVCTGSAVSGPCAGRVRADSDSLFALVGADLTAPVTAPVATGRAGAHPSTKSKLSRRHTPATEAPLLWGWGLGHT